MKENSRTLFRLERFSHSPFLRVCVASTNVMLDGILGQRHYAYLEASWAINEPNNDPNLYLANGCEITSAIHLTKMVLVGGLKHLDLYQMIRVLRQKNIEIAT